MELFLDDVKSFIFMNFHASLTPLYSRGKSWIISNDFEVFHAEVSSRQKYGEGWQAAWAVAQITFANVTVCILTHGIQSFAVINIWCRESAEAFNDWLCVAYVCAWKIYAFINYLTNISVVIVKLYLNVCLNTLAITFLMQKPLASSGSGMHSCEASINFN